MGCGFLSWWNGALINREDKQCAEIDVSGCVQVQDVEEGMERWKLRSWDNSYLLLVIQL
jgi:hypothetical protein